MMNNMLEDDSGLPVGIFKGWQRVLLGHYHKRQEWLNGAMGYIGSPWQTRADEWGQPKGYAILDTDTNALTFVDCVWGPRFHRFDATVPIPSEAWGQVAPGDHLKVMVQNEEAALQTRKFLAEHLPPSVRVAVEAKEQLEVQPRFAFKKGTTLTEYAHHYVQDKKPKQLDPKSLMFFWSKITGMQP
jgi:DNA repair exonuclease SbcCD nuclease subunit